METGALLGAFRWGRVSSRPLKRLFRLFAVVEARLRCADQLCRGIPVLRVAGDPNPQVRDPVGGLGAGGPELPQARRDTVLSAGSGGLLRLGQQYGYARLAVGRPKAGASDLRP